MAMGNPNVGGDDLAHRLGCRLFLQGFDAQFLGDSTGFPFAAYRLDKITKGIGSSIVRVLVSVAGANKDDGT